MRCVKDTLPPRARERWLLITMRLSHSSLTGTERTEVAVGTVRLTSMFCTVRAGAPRSTVRVGSSLAVPLAGASGSLGTGLVVEGFLGGASARGLDFAALDVGRDVGSAFVAAVLGSVLGSAFCSAFA